MPEVASVRSWRQRLCLAFGWLAIACWGMALGAKVFDLLVLGASWSARLPDSLALMPYGPRYPINPGDFFQPLSVLLAIGVIGALGAGWTAPRPARRWLGLSLGLLAVIWILTPLVFWPIIIGLWDVAQARSTLDAAQVVELSHRWFVWDWLRVALIAGGFGAQARAVSLP